MERMLSATLKDIEQIRQVTLGNLDSVSFKLFDGTVLKFVSDETMMKVPNSGNKKGKVKWLNQNT